MRAVIRSFDWDDLRPDRGADETVHLAMTIGPQHGPGDEVFYITVCTLQALSAWIRRDGIVVGRHLLLVGDINRTRIEAFLQDRLRRLDGTNWVDLAEKINRLAYSEFEDYTAAAE